MDGLEAAASRAVEEASAVVGAVIVAAGEDAATLAR
jgi:hypothetical protein